MKAFLATALVLSVLCGSTPAPAHFREPVPAGWDDWAMRQFNVGGNRCCDPSDVYLFKGAWRYEYEGEGGRIAGVTLMLDSGEEIYVGKQRFVDRTRDPTDLNPTGTAVIWYRQIQEMFCFDPPGAVG